ncbi:hypothetical protein K2X33_15530 [bacterium]|nr:hypothetical protein [bacterium]
MHWRPSREILKSPLAGWFLFAFFVQVLFITPVGTNPAARWATLCAMAEDHSFEIDPYLEHTIDWSRGPNTHYYSNKPPGPALVGFPVFWVLDTLQTRGIANRDARDQTRYLWRGVNLRLLSFLFQILPFFFLVALWIGRLERLDLSNRAIMASAVALLFGTTSTIFLNSYFGHGMTAVFALGLIYALSEKSVFWTAFFFGMALLCDYTSSLLLVPLTPLWGRSLWRSPRKLYWLWRFVAGAALPGALWIWYHTVCFGSPFATSGSFLNPLFVEASDAGRFLGIFSLPDRHVIFELALGAKRGLLFTQPWVLFFLAAVWMLPTAQPGVLPNPRKQWVHFAVLSFSLLFLLVSSFNGWHGGNTAGPRYLTAGLVLCAAALGLLWDSLSGEWEKRFWWLLGVSAFLQIVFLSVYQGMPGPEETLWGYYRRQILGDHGGTPISRLAVGVPILIFLLYRTRPKNPSFSKKPAR